MAEIQEISTVARSESEDVGENQIHADIAGEPEGEKPTEATAAAEAEVVATTPTTTPTTPTTAVTTPSLTTVATSTTGSKKCQFSPFGQKRDRPTDFRIPYKVRL